MFKNSTQNSINYAEKLDESFKAIENEIFELEKLNFYSVGEYCEKLRNDVDIAYQKQLEILQFFRDGLYDRIHEYENECYLHLRRNIQSFKKNEELIINIRRDLSKWFQNLNDLQFNNSEMEQAIDYSYKQIAQLQQLNAQLQAFIFDRKSLNDNDSIYLPINSNNFEVQKNLVEHIPNTAQTKKGTRFGNKVYVNDIITEDFDKKEIDYLVNGEYVLCGSKGDYKISIYVIDDEKCLASQHAVYESRVRFSIRTSNDLIYLKLYDISMNESLLHVFNRRLELLKTSSRLNGSCWMSTDDQFVYLIELNNKIKPIRVYSHELDLLYTVDILFDNWQNVNGFLVKDNMFFIFNRDYYIFRIGDMQTGLLLNQFCIEKAFIRTGQSFCIFRNKIVVLDSTTSGQCLNFYTIEGKLVKSIQLDLQTFANDLIYKNNQPRLYDHHNNIIFKLNSDIFKFK